MKKKFLSLIILILLISCNSNDDLNNQKNDGVDLFATVNNYNKSFEFINLKKSKPPKKIDKLKALKLGLVDAAAAVGVAPVWSIPIVGPYAGLWLSFGASWAAAGEGPEKNAIKQKINTDSIENLITENSEVDNPLSEIGINHNKALNILATSHNSMLVNNEINNSVINYMTSNSFMNTTLEDREKFISNSQAKTLLVNNYKKFENVTSINDLIKEINNNINSTQSQKQFILTTTLFLNENANAIDEIQLTKYIDGLENIVINNLTLSEIEKEEILSYLSILNYSYCLWYNAD